MALPAPLQLLGLLDLPDEVLTRILRIVEGWTEDYFLSTYRCSRHQNKLLLLRQVCRGLQRGAEGAVTCLEIGLDNDWFYSFPGLQDVSSEDDPADGAQEEGPHVTGRGARATARARAEARARGARLDFLQQSLRRWRNLRFLFLPYEGDAESFGSVIRALAGGCPHLRGLRLEMPDESGARLPDWEDHIHHLTCLEHLQALGLQAENISVTNFPSLPRLRKLSLRGVHNFTLRTQPALEELQLVTSHRPGVLLDLDCRVSCTRLRRLKLLSGLELASLTLPRSLEVLELAAHRLHTPLDLGADLPSLSNLTLRGLHEWVSPRGLPLFLSKGSLRRLSLTKVASPAHASELAGLASQTRLTSLDIHRSALTGALDFPPLPSLTDLCLSGNSLSCIGVASLSCLTRLQVMDCPSLTALPGLGQLKDLVFLRVTGCRQLLALEDVAGYDNLQVIHLIDLGAVLQLKISRCPGIERLTDMELRYMGSLESLEVLDLRRLVELTLADALCGRALRTIHIARCPELRELSLDDVDSLETLDLEDLWLPAMPLLPYGCQAVRLTGVAFASPYLHMTKARNFEPLQIVELEHCTALKQLCFGEPPPPAKAHPGGGHGDASRGSTGANGGADEGGNRGTASAFCPNSLEAKKMPLALVGGGGNASCSLSGGGVEGVGATPEYFLRTVKSLTFSRLPGLAALTLPASLETLRVSSCPELDELQLGSILNLRHLELRDMPKLRGLECAGSLRTLSLRSCPELRTVSAKPLLNLEMLQLQDLSRLCRVDCRQPLGNLQVTACPELENLH